MTSMLMNPFAQVSSDPMGLAQLASDPMGLARLASDPMDLAHLAAPSTFTWWGDESDDEAEVERE